jgi:hypothetical protein
MDGAISGYTLAGTIAVGCWLLAAGVSVPGLFRRPDLNHLSGRLILPGLFLALAGWTWFAVIYWPEWTFTRAGQAAGLAIAALTIHIILTRSQREVFSVLLVCGFSTGAQMYALGEVWWGIPFPPSPSVLPVWAMLRDVAALIGCGALAVSVAAMLDSFVRRRIGERFMPEPDGDAEGQLTTGNRAMRLAWMVFTLSLSLDVARSWVGWGDVMQDRFAWLLVAWLLLAAGCSSTVCSVMSRRTGRVLVVLSFVAGLLATVGVMHR